MLLGDMIIFHTFGTFPISQPILLLQANTSINVKGHLHLQWKNLLNGQPYEDILDSTITTKPHSIQAFLNPFMEFKIQKEVSTRISQVHQ